MATNIRKLPSRPPIRRHADFQDFVEDVANAASAATTPRAWRLLFDKIEHLAERCKAHMKAEETDGVFEAIERAAPSRAEAARALKAQHAGILAELEEVVAAMRTTSDISSIDPALASRVQHWVAVVHKHEADEATLLQEVYGTDLGAGD
jgi:hypothetical protein